VGFASDGVYVSLGQANGTFGAAWRRSDGFDHTTGWTSNNIYPRKMADVNGDGQVDIVGFGNQTLTSISIKAYGDDTLQGGIGNDTLIGMGGNDVLFGGDGNDTLQGLAGNDTLNGGTGADLLDGGKGNDIYVLGRGSNADTIQESDATVGNNDVLQFLSDIATDQLWLRQVSNNLEVSIIGTSDKFTLSNWYLGSQYHVEQFKTSDGKTLLDSNVQNLVSAMAGFAPPSAGQTTLPANYASTLNPVIAANWQ
jgi:Ca2+-binding RTX toxin-like protein